MVPKMDLNRFQNLKKNVIEPNMEESYMKKNEEKNGDLDKKGGRENLINIDINKTYGRENLAINKTCGKENFMGGAIKSDKYPNKVRREPLQRIGLRNPFTWKLKIMLDFFCKDKGISGNELLVKTNGSNKWKITMKDLNKYSDGLDRVLLSNGFLIGKAEGDTLNIRRYINKNLTKKS
jgi:hypothetical protein